MFGCRALSVMIKTCSCCHVQARPLFKGRRKFPKMADPLLQGLYPTRGLYQALAVAAMCLQEQAATRSLIGDVVTALTYLASQTYDLNSVTAQGTRGGPSIPRSTRGFDNQHAVQSPHLSSPDQRQRDTVKGVSEGAKVGRGGPGGGSVRKLGLAELQSQEALMDSPVQAGRGRESPENANRDLFSEHAVAEATVGGENWRERKTASTFDNTQE